MRSLILPWGNPYYTKLALAAVGGSPPDVAIVHATRLTVFAPAGLLEPLTPEILARHGIGPDKFRARGLEARPVGGKQYAIPLDTHPFVLYFNTELAKQAGLLDGRHAQELNGPDGLLDAFEAVKKKTGQTGLVFETRGVTPWRLFLTLYTQLGGAPVVKAGGTQHRLDDAKALKALDWMAQPHARGAGGQDLDYQALGRAVRQRRRRPSCSTASGRSRPFRRRSCRSPCARCRRSSTRPPTRPTRTRS